MEKTFPNNTQATYDSSDSKNALGRRLSRRTSDRGRERYKTTEKELEERERAKSRTRERAKSRTRELENNRERTKSRTRETEFDKERVNTLERAKSRAREKATDSDKERVSTLERANTRSRDADDRGRSRRVPDDNSNDRGRSKSRPREIEERGRSKSKTRETEERRGRSKSSNRNDNRERAISREREKDIDFEKERDLHLERLKARGQDEAEKPKQLDRSKSRQPKIPETKVTTRIYIDDSRQFKTLALTSKMNALNIIEYFKKRNAIEDGNEWTLFELVNEFGLERPLRDWEIVTTVIGSWEPKTSNALLLKKYAYRSSLTVEGLSNGVPPLFGWLHLETKKNKWQKRYFFLKDGSIYHCKDAKAVDPVLLCSIYNFDVYTLTRTIKKAPKPFLFALKSQDRVVMFENSEDYVHYLCADHMEKMKDWVLSIRTARNQMMLENHPELFSAITGEQTTPTSPQLSSTKNLQPLLALAGDELDIGDKNTEKSSGFSSSEQWANVRRFVRVFKSGSLLDFERHNPPIKPVEPEVTSFIEGSLLATTEAFFENYKEKEKSNNSNGGTLVQINGDVKFHKGSLLETKISMLETKINRDHGESNGTLVHIDDDVKFHKGSLLEGRGNRDHVDTNVSSSSTLVNIDDELKFHKGSLLATRGAFSPANKDHFEISLSHTPEYNKGSLLARGLTSNGKETFEISQSQTPEFNKGSLLARGLLSPSKDSFEGSPHSSNSRPRPERKPSNGPLISVDPPLIRNGPKITSPSTSTSPGKTLLQLDLSPDVKHTLNLRNKDFKPLLSFVPGEKPEPVHETEAMRVQREARETGKTLLNLNIENDSDESKEADKDIDDDENDL
ncbi:3541_t:CDS:2 [Ambispora leptoticha]|uniref:3541_t:CDS:1 n=1 Tax=Ambispora leptoticha TaxID=144679 RepID=A0A9N9AGN0_9GLOM|nr:3541_t:CDS:2 [Ambispora leptoticha]